MQRNLRLLAIGIALCSGPIVHAQGPMPYPPQGYGYPGYPMQYGQPMPMQYGQPMPAQYRQPMMLPNNPYANQPMLPPIQVAGPNQPYYVTDMAPGKAPAASKAVPTNPAAMIETLPPVPPGEPVTIYQGPSYGQPIETEPMALYEGKRYAAEMKLDNSHAWVQASFLHWWIQRPNVSPLLNSGTSTLFGGEIGPKELTGMQAQLGYWLDPNHINAVEINGLWLGECSRQYQFASNAAGSPPLTIPTTTASVPVAAPGTLAGNLNANYLTSFYGAEANLTQNVLRVNGWTLDYFGGGKYLYMNDNLSINQTRTALTGTALTFGGAAVPAGSSVQVYDSFNVNNRFFGGDIGTRLHWTYCGFDVGLSAKVALGATSYTTVVDGNSTLGAATRTGGTFAQTSNIGRITDTQFTVIPEVEATASYQLTCNLRLFGGYTFLYWNHVQRAADQIDHSINPAQSPTSPTFSPTAAGGPFFPNVRTGLLIQGVNIGLEYKY